MRLRYYSQWATRLILFDGFLCQAMSFNTGLSFEIYDLAGLGTDDVGDESLVDDVVDAIVQAMDDVQEQLEEQEEHHHLAGGGGGQMEGDGQPVHSIVHQPLNASVAGNIPSSRQEVWWGEGGAIQQSVDERMLGWLVLCAEIVQNDMRKVSSHESLRR